MIKNKFRLVMVSVLGIFVFATVAFAIGSSTEGAELARLENLEIALDSENKELNQKMIEETSLGKVTKIAEDLGMEKPKNFLYLNQREAVAKLP